MSVKRVPPPNQPYPLPSPAPTQDEKKVELPLLQPTACVKHTIILTALSLTTHAGVVPPPLVLLLVRYPWWPAVIVPPTGGDDDEDEEEEQQQPAATAAPAAAAFSQGAAAAGQRGRHQQPVVFVRFLGTHDTAWLEPGKVSPWTVQLGERSSKTKASAFVSALREGRAYAMTGEKRMREGRRPAWGACKLLYPRRACKSWPLCAECGAW